MNNKYNFYLIIISSLQGASSCVTTQFCHSSGTMCLVSGLRFGSTLVLPAPAFDAKKTLEALMQERYG